MLHTYLSWEVLPNEEMVRIRRLKDQQVTKQLSADPHMG